MENKRGIEEGVKEKIRKILRFPQEAPTNPEWVGSPNKKPIITFYWQPHDYRLYLNFSKTNFNNKIPPNPTLKNMQSRVSGFYKDYTYKTRNYNSEHHYKDFMGCTIIIRKNTVEVINNWHKKQWREIQAYDLEEIDHRIEEVTDELDKQCIDALKVFIKLHGGSTDYKVIKKRCENGIQGDRYVDKIPEGMVIRDGVFKKLYKEKVELYKPAQVKTFFKNRVIEDIAPQIASEVNNIHRTISDELTPVLKDFTKQIKTHLEVQQDTLKTQKDMRDTMGAIRSSMAKEQELRVLHQDDNSLEMEYL